VVISPLHNDQDANGDALTITNVSGLSPNIGTLTLAGDGQSLTYAAPASAANGTVVTFTYKAYDGTEYSNVATVTITIGRGLHALIILPAFCGSANQRAMFGLPRRDTRSLLAVRITTSYRHYDC
jgi:Bacterial Ig domain